MRKIYSNLPFNIEFQCYRYYKRVICGAKYENLLCHLWYDLPTKNYTVQFVKNGAVFMRVNLPREIIHGIDFKFVSMFIESNFKNEVKSMLCDLSPIQHAKNLFFEFSQIPGIGLEQTIEASLLHINGLYIDELSKQCMVKTIHKLKEDYR